jgi:hypothetical protein
LLVVITQQTAGGTTKVWANDGTLDLSKGLGWFKLYQGGFHILPFPNAGYNQGGVNAVSYSPGTSHVFTRWLIDPVSPVGFKNDNYGVARTLVLGLATLPIVTPQDLAQLAGATGGKVLAVNIRRVGLEWSVLEGGIWWPVPDASMISNMSIFYEVSQDGGTNWSNVLEPRTGGLSKSTMPGFMATGLSYRLITLFIRHRACIRRRCRPGPRRLAHLLIRGGCLE